MRSHSLVLRRPGVLGTVFVLLLAIATAGAAAIFLLYSSVALSPIPVPDADQVVQFGPLLSTSDYNVVVRESTGLTDVSAYVRRRVKIERADVVMLCDSLLVTPHYSSLMRLPVLGNEGVDATHGEKTLIVSTKIWKAISGDKPFETTTVQIEQQPYTIVGLLPNGYVGTSLAFVPEILIPIPEVDPAKPPIGDPILRFPMGGWLTVLARLKPGIELEGASAEVKTLTKRDPKRDSSPNAPPFLERLSDAAVPFNVRVPVKVTFRALVGLTIAIVFISLTNAVVLAGFQILSRGREYLLRQTLGASPGHISRRLAGEYALLGLVGGGVGLLVTVVLMARLSQIQITRYTSLSVSLAPSGTVLVAALAASTLVATVSALLWGRAVPRQDLSRVSSANSGLPVRRHSLALGVAILLQLTLATTLAVPALLLVRSLNNLTSVPLGFDRSDTLWAHVEVGQTAATRSRGRARLNEVLDELKAMSIVDAVGISSSVPFGWVRFLWDVVPPGSDKPVELSGAFVDSDYFRALGLPFVRGAAFSDADSIVVNATAARRLFGDSEPVGQTVKVVNVRPMRIAGVVEDSRYFSVDEQVESLVYFPIESDFPPSVAIVVKAKGNVASVLTDVRNVLSRADHGMPPMELMTMQKHIDLYFGRARLMAIASATLALLGMLISVVGTAVIGGHIVRARVHEAAVRLALGEQQHSVFGRMAFHGLSWGVAGVAIGVYGARQMANLSAKLLFGLEPTDLVTISIAVSIVFMALLVGVGSAALNVARMDPVDRLKVAV